MEVLGAAAHLHHVCGIREDRAGNGSSAGAQDGEVASNVAFPHDKLGAAGHKLHSRGLGHDLWISDITASM